MYEASRMKLDIGKAGRVDKSAVGTINRPLQLV